MTVFGVILLCGCGAGNGLGTTDMDNLVGSWENKDEWKMHIYEPESEETSGQIDLTNWNFYEGTRLGDYSCQESSHRLIITYPDYWNIEMMKDVYTYEFEDQNTLVLYPNGDTEQSIEFFRAE